MKQIITGPFGRLAYHDASRKPVGLYPALNAPCCEFARADRLVAANNLYAPRVVEMPRQLRSRAAMAMFGTPTKREV
ncbi:hypothetical protein [Sulfitobacter guttiformis]|uniref:Uncharacterized protein n=1 Tax=Sulfitobacter guttiformis TaxID=74349 RepID=A0A420DJH1_9RHOB|nr:hypothetical protein [Sulfitobacter guttiformis]KIN71832.1 hypothetical protein Z949_996 [Sulfitobacter guttiformis KCTC 32187]RKE94354.1 hypothetical protein C8N30_3479 [Sulfitobacter guttiformis]